MNQWFATGAVLLKTRTAGFQQNCCKTQPCDHGRKCGHVVEHLKFGHIRISNPDKTPFSGWLLL